MIWTHMALFAVSTHIDTIVGWIFEYMLLPEGLIFLRPQWLPPSCFDRPGLQVRVMTRSVCFVIFEPSQGLHIHNVTLIHLQVLKGLPVPLLAQTFSCSAGCSTSVSHPWRQAQPLRRFSCRRLAPTVVGAALFRAGHPAAGCIVLCTMGWHALQHGPIIGALGREAWRLMNEFVISAFPPRGAACPRGP